MGILLSRFRTKLSTKDVLEEIDKKLKSIDEFQQDTIERQKRLARRLLVIFILVYIIAIAAFIFITSIQKFKLYYFTGLVTFALLAWISHKSIRWYFNRQMVSNSEKSVELRKKKKKILEEVMDTETYKVAKEILDRFGDKPQHPLHEAKSSHTPAPSMSKPNTPGTELRQRKPEQSAPSTARVSNPGLQQNTPSNINAGSIVKQPPPKFQPTQPMLSTQRPVAMNYGNPPLRPLPRPILPRERGVLDRMMDFFVGDGPHQRYALICRHCGGHNGMALQEEFEFVSYYCCYCYQFNPPRKMRPMGPRLPLPPPPAPANPSSTNSVQEGNGAEKSDKKDHESDKSDHSEDNSPPGEETEVSPQTTCSDSEETDKMEIDTPEPGKVISDDVGQDTSSLR